jgi:predicted enzyme related to lactoylglutathione lyase
MSRRPSTVEFAQQQEENSMSNAEVLGRFVWHELMTPDTAGATAFYSKVVPWRTAPSSVPGYTIWMSGQTQVGGLMAQPGNASDAPPHWLVYIGTPNVDATCSKAQGLGARVCKPAQDIPNVGRFAVLADPQGAVFAVFTPGAGSPPQAPKPPEGGFSWHELATSDREAALRFYVELFGWQLGATHDMGGMGVYQLIQHGGQQVGGIYTTHGAGSAPAWLSYVQVTDCSRAAAAAKSAGGRVLNGPMEVPGGSWIAVLMDPQGGAFAVHEEPRRTSQPKPAPPTLKAAPPPKAPAPPAAPAKAPASKPVVAPAKPASAAPPPQASPKAVKPAAKKAAKKKAKKKAKRTAKKAKAARKKARPAARKAKPARKTRRPAAKKRPARKAARKKSRARGRRR